MFQNVDWTVVVMVIVFSALGVLFMVHELRKDAASRKEWADHQAKLADELANSVCSAVDGTDMHCMIKVPDGTVYLSTHGTKWHYASNGSEVRWSRNEHLCEVWDVARARNDAKELGLYEEQA